MIYVMSDIHGNMRRFRSVMEQIRLRPEDTLYVLGDIIDRFPDGIKILQELMAMPNVKILMGNHEYMMLNAMDGKYVDTGYATGFAEARFQRARRNLCISAQLAIVLRGRDK